MSRSTKSAFRITAHAVVTAVLGLTLAGVASTPALATETGVITQSFGSGYPTEGTCADAGRIAQSRGHADAYTCYPRNGKWDGYLTWYT